MALVIVNILGVFAYLEVHGIGGGSNNPAPIPAAPSKSPGAMSNTGFFNPRRMGAAG